MNLNLLRMNLNILKRIIKFICNGKLVWDFIVWLAFNFNWYYWFEINFNLKYCLKLGQMRFCGGGVGFYLFVLGFVISWYMFYVQSI